MCDLLCEIRGGQLFAVEGLEIGGPPPKDVVGSFPNSRFSNCDFGKVCAYPYHGATCDCVKLVCLICVERFPFEQDHHSDVCIKDDISGLLY